MPTETRPNALQLLAADHREVEDLFEKFEKAKGSSAKQEIVQKICDELRIHTLIEEEIYYPAVRGKVEDDLLDEAYVEHDGAKVLINELLAASPDDDFYDAKVKVLQEQIEHHVKEEEKERDNMFTQTRRADVDLEAMGEAILARKTELMAMAEAGSLPPAKPKTMETQ